MMNTFDLLKQLTQTVGVSGREENIVNLLTDILSDYGEVSVDRMNNVFCTFGNGYHFLLDAHLDEIGFIVTSITDDGFIKIDACGSPERRCLLGYEVSVWGKEEIKGVISTLPPHLKKSSKDEHSPEYCDIAIDCGLNKEQLEKYISLGDSVTLKRNFTPLLNNFISASCLDDRAGVASILLCLDELKKLPCKITVMFSAQEEVGKRGGTIGAFAKNVDEAICVDVSFAYTPGCDRDDCGLISNGAMIGFSPVLNKKMSNELLQVAKENNISYQQEIMNGDTGTNADVIGLNESSIKTALISIPEKYMHQSVEVVDVSDVESVSNLIVAYISKRAGELNA